MIRRGSRGDDVRKLQVALNVLGSHLVVDGVFGPRTSDAVRSFATRAGSSDVPSWLVGAIMDSARDLQAVEPPTSGIQSVGAWCGRASLANPERDVAFAADNGIDRLDVMVNDHSKWRAPHVFTLRNAASIRRLAAMAQARGISVHLTSWIMPHRDYLRGAAAALVPLCADIGAASLQWDAEEPWTQATDRPGYDQASNLLAQVMAPLTCPMGVTGIGFGSESRLGPLIAVCDYVVPQAYSTRTSGQAPGAAQVKFHRRWQRLFGKPVVMGLAAYRQGGIPGHSTRSALQAAVDATAELDVNTVIYWSLRHIRASKTAQSVIRAIGAA